MALTVKGGATFTGGPEMLAELKALSQKLSNEIAAGAVGQAASIIKEQAIALAPQSKTSHTFKGTTFAPGTLKNSIYAYRDRRYKNGARFIVGARVKGKGLANAFYAAFVEYGTVHQRPQPFMRPAFREKQSEALDAIINGIRAGLDREARKFKFIKPA